ncbi:MAG: hypothetical protein V7746_24455 [Halioglobus sp.]
MRSTILWFIIFASSAVTLAQDREEATTMEPSSREALLKGMVMRDRGEITALEPSSQEGGSVIIGYSSGAVLNCYGNQSCKEFNGTPNMAVEHIAVSSRGASEIIWVTYRHGAIYQCAIKNCSKFDWDGPEQE